MSAVFSPWVSETVLGASADGVFRVIINRAEKRNALSRAVLDDLRRMFEAHATDESLRVATLTAAGSQSFAAGGDLRDLASVRTLEDAVAMATQARTALDAIRRFPVPVVAALNGVALGGGAELAVACDLRIAAAHAGIGFVQGQLNISTGWGGGIDLMRLLGPARALAVLGRGEVLGAAQAHALGFAQPASGFDDVLSWYRTGPAHLSAVALRTAVRAVRLGAGSDPFLGERLDALEELYLERVLPSRDGNEGIEAFLARRPPRWEDA